MDTTTSDASGVEADTPDGTNTATPELSERSDERPITFSVRGAREGFIECLPIALGVAGYGLVFGVLASRAGLTVAEATLMSATVLAGAAQLVAIELWEYPIPVATIVATTFVVNLRYVLMGAALRPWFGELSPLEAYGSLFFTADENWALTMGKLSSGSRRGAFLLGSGLAIWSLWIFATVVGASAGDVIGDLSRVGFDFVLTAIFLAIAVGLWDGRATLLPWVAAFGVAVASAAALPGRWYIVLGGIAGCAVGVIESGE